MVVFSPQPFKTLAADTLSFELDFHFIEKVRGNKNDQGNSWLYTHFWFELIALAYRSLGKVCINSLNLLMYDWGDLLLISKSTSCIPLHSHSSHLSCKWRAHVAVATGVKTKLSLKKFKSHKGTSCLFEFNLGFEFVYVFFYMNLIIY